MQKTENLELNIIEGTDVPAYAPFNENMIKLDGNVKKVDDEINALKTSSESTLSRLGIIDEEQINQNSLISKNTNDIATLKNDVEVISKNMSKVKIEENGIIKTGTLHTIKLKKTPTFASSVFNVPIYDYDEHTIKNNERYFVGITSAFTTVDLTSLFGITDVEDFELLSCTTYAKGYYNYTSSHNPEPMLAKTVAVMTPSGSNNIMLELTGTSINAVKQSVGSVPGTWQPGGFSTSQDGESTIILRFIKYDKE
jgi:hypothetical protein